METDVVVPGRLVGGDNGTQVVAPTPPTPGPRPTPSEPNVGTPQVGVTSRVYAATGPGTGHGPFTNQVLTSGRRESGQGKVSLL